MRDDVVFLDNCDDSTTTVHPRVEEIRILCRWRKRLIIRNVDRVRWIFQVVIVVTAAVTLPHEAKENSAKIVLSSIIRPS